MKQAFESFLHERNPDLVKALVADVSTAIQTLLESKHLYQSVLVEPRAVENFLEQTIRAWEPGSIEPEMHIVPGSLSTFGNEALWNCRWRLIIEGVGHGAQQNEIRFILPTIKIACNLCDGILPPHNPGFKGNVQQPFDHSFNENGKVIQIFVIPYQCQSCKKEPVVFILRREGFKFQIVGRSQFEQVAVPKGIPKQERNFYRDALISHNSGRGLAALFFFRTFIEQYMRRITGIVDCLIGGDELAEKYHACLAPSFPSQFRTFRTLYGALSEKMHQANEDAELSARTKREIDAHFEMLKMIPIPNTQE